MNSVPVTSEALSGSEVSWFAPICSDDYRFLGVPEGDLRSSWANTRDIALKADELGFRNMLCPSSYQVGQDTLTFAAHTKRHLIKLSRRRCAQPLPLSAIT